MSTLKARREAALLAHPIPEQPDAFYLLMLLRDHELRRSLLPGFDWHFPDCESCAMGLAKQLWPVQTRFVDISVTTPDTAGEAAWMLSELLGITHGWANFVFLEGGGYPGNDANVTPDMVADALEQAIASRLEDIA